MQGPHRRRARRRLLAAALAALLGTGACAPTRESPASGAETAVQHADLLQGEAAMARDIATQPAMAQGSRPGGFAHVGAWSYFTAMEGSAAGLWRTDGTPEHTEMVLPQRLGDRGGAQRELTDVGGVLFFLSGGSPGGRVSLWKSDGTAAGTSMVRDDLCCDLLNSSVYGLTNVGGVLYFAAAGGPPTVGGIPDAELWRSDGTASGTYQVKDLLPGWRSSEPRGFTAHRGALFFFAQEAVDSPALWTSDGTEAGTRVLAQVNGSWLTSAGSKLYFVVAGATGAQLWVTDGTASGTRMLRDFTGHEGPSGLFPTGDAVLFRAGDEAGGELWRSDGTVEGTRRLVDIVPGPEGSYVAEFAAVGPFVSFTASTPGGSGRELWRTDGTAEGTQPLRDVLGVVDPAQRPGRLVAADGLLYFTAGNYVRNLWRTDGTPEGTYELARGVAFEDYSVPGMVMMPVPGGVLFSAWAAETGWELWHSDGTPAGTGVLRNLEQERRSSEPRELVEVGGTLFFVATDGEAGEELWRSDGTAESTVRVRDILPGPGGSAPRGLVSFQRRLYFLTFSSRGTELWRSDGTAPGTVPVRQLSSSAGQPAVPPVLVARPDGLYVLLPAERSLWFSDGTSEGTRALGPASAGPLVAAEGNLFYEAPGVDGYRRALWARTDASGAARLLGSVCAEPCDLRLASVAPLGPNLLFTGRTDGTPYDIGLWFSDATVEGTRPVMASWPSGSPLAPEDLTRVGDQVLFSCADPVAQARVLCRTDGTEQGTVQLTSASSSVVGLRPFGAVGGRALALAFEASVGRELWVSDGTAEGTSRLLELAPGPWDGVLEPARAWPSRDGQRAYFVGSQPEAGREAWVTDGTAEGTHRLADVAPGARSSDPSGFTEAGDYLFFAADDGVHGREPWAVRQRVTVDTEAPVLTCADITLEATSPSGALLDRSPLSASDDVTGLPRVDFSRDVQARFPIGSTPVSATAYDAAGNSATCEFTVTVRDTRPPLIQCTGPQYLHAESALGAPLRLSGVTASDVAGPVTLHSEPESGSFLPLGTNRVVVTAMDAVGLTASCELDVIVVDVQAPTLVCPQSIGAVAPTSDGVEVAFSVWAHDAVSAVRVTSTPPSGSRFPLGATQVRVSASDDANNVSTCTFLVAVVLESSTELQLICPAGLTVEATSAQGTPVELPLPVAVGASDLADVVLSPRSGSVFPLGSTEVQAWAMDALHRVATCHFSLTVRDTTAPRVLCPGAVVLEASGPAGARFDGAVQVEDAVSAPVVSVEPASGTMLALGETRVRYSARDAAGNEGVCVTSVTVQDTTAPSLTCPPAQELQATERGGARADFAAEANDSVSPVQLVYSHAPGSLLPEGTTLVHVDATDASGNVSSCEFTVRVSRQESGGCQATGQSGPSALLLLALWAWRRRAQRM